jgi:hypothetical protein
MRRLRNARQLVSRLLRVSAYLFVLTLGLGLLCARQAKAQATEGAARVGEQLLRLASADEGLAHELSINGQTVHIASAHTKLPLGTVLGRFQKACEENADGMVKDLQDLEASLDRAPTAEGHPGIGLLRDDRDGRGVVACFAAGEPTDPSRLLARLERFTTSYDFADLGDLRYVAARTLETGSTEVVASWTQGHFHLDEMFPEHGDASGEDPKAAPRPSGARRILSAHDARAPHGVFLYEVTGEASTALDSYAKVMTAKGWTTHEAVRERDKEVAAFERAGVDVLITASRLEGGLALVSVVEMPAPFAGKVER